MGDAELSNTDQNLLDKKSFMSTNKDRQKNNRTIGILIFSMGTGGAERFASYYIEHLLKQNYVVHLFLMVDYAQYPVPKGVYLHILSASHGRGHGLFKFIEMPFLARKYARMIRKLGIDYSFSMLTRPNLINVLSRKFFGNKAKTILGVRSYTSLSYGYGDIQSKINKILIAKLYPDSDLIIGNSYGNAKDLVDNFNIDQNQVITIPNPIDLDKIEGIEPENGIFEENYFNLITTGRLVREKNHKLLIDAISSFPNVRLYIIGGGILYDDLVEQINRLKMTERVFLLGQQLNPFKFLKSADLFVFASNHEGFPNVLIEAMACDLPILTTNCKSGPDEILGYDGENTDSLMMTKSGILVPVDNLELMRKGIEYFLNEEEYRNNCIAAVKERVKDFDKQQILNNYTDKIFQ